MELKIVKRFKDAHRSLTKKEHELLEAAILEDGEVLEEILVRESDKAVVDGHNRYEIATKYDLSFSVKEKSFADDDAVELWIRRHQAARRNLTPHEFKLNMGMIYKLEKKAVGRPRKFRHSDGIDDADPAKQGEAADRVASDMGFSARSVERAENRADAYYACVKAVQHLIDEKPSRASDRALIALAKKSPSDQTALAREVRTGQKATFDAALGFKAKSGGKDEPRKRSGKPPKQFPRSHWLKQWNQSIGPLVRMADKIASEVGESQSKSHKAVQKRLQDATDEMMTWMAKKK